MTTYQLTELAFAAGAHSLAAASSAVDGNDRWVLQGGESPTIYLARRQTQVLPPQPPTSQPAIITWEYHVVFHPTFCTPTLLFHASDPAGALVAQDHVLHMLAAQPQDQVTADNKEQQALLVANISYCEHPILGLPFLHIHPCETDMVLAALVDGDSQYHQDPAKVLVAWLGLVGSAFGGGFVSPALYKSIMYC